MTREEKQKAIDALKISAPIMAMTQEEFNDYIQTLNKIMDWLEQEPCEDAISRQAVLDGIDTYINKAQSTGTQDDFYSFAELVVKELPSVTPQEPFMNKPCVAHQVCREDKVKVLEKIRAEIERQEKWLLQAGCTTYNVDIAFDSIKSVLAESEE